MARVFDKSGGFVKGLIGCLLGSGLGLAAVAAPPDTSFRPEPRPMVQRAVPETVPTSVVKILPTALAVRQSLRPKDRPRGFTQKIAAATPTPASSGRRGRICGVNEIKGQNISAIVGRIRGCGVSDPVRVTEVSGVKLSQPALMDCTTAKALNTWVRQGVVPAVGRLGGGPSSLRVVAHYACRTRNGKAGAKISEHGRGRAIDIAAIRLKSGADISVLKGWRDPVQGKVLKKMHKAACGPFGTVLGPNADRYHKDHLHLDTARYRSGAYCR
ncbi:extensin family protein [Aliiroseovarius sediminis]|uniref:extensin-like domain-containing protein n=1 Tax=Aliiroseovarius sediminis TaxID=2925839 RepID=UPI001F565720|nr:extensin family protein [Aliiroseovarius sediminis]MCI2395285.1 extensin family protein [Aliiroseovarius sediminis]